MKSEKMDAMRKTCAALAETGDGEMTNAMIYQAVCAQTPDEKARARRTLQNLVDRRELVRIRDGVYRYDAEKAPRRMGESYQRIWRMVRAAKPGWTLQDAATTTMVHYSSVRRYVLWLEEQGFVEAWGRDGTAKKWRGTLQARERRDTPYPPLEARDDKWADVRRAALGIVRVLLESDPDNPSSKKKIAGYAGLLVERFSQDECKNNG